MEPESMPDRLSGRILFHGTFKGYLEQQTGKWSRFRQDVGRIELSDDFGEGYSQAIRTCYYENKAYPIVLVIDSHLIRTKLFKDETHKHYPRYFTTSLPLDSYRTVDCYQGFISSKQELSTIVEEILKASHI